VCEEREFVTDTREHLSQSSLIASVDLGFVKRNISALKRAFPTFQLAPIFGPIAARIQRIAQAAGDSDLNACGQHGNACVFGVGLAKTAKDTQTFQNQATKPTLNGIPLVIE
jgi:hypothetical protein